MPNHPDELVSPTSLVLLQPLLTALDPADTAILKPTSSMPAPCFRVPGIRMLLAATPINTLPVFRAAMISVAALRKVDVVVVKHGFAPEMLDAVEVDVVAGRTDRVLMLWSLARYRGVDGSCWLVPPAGGAGPSVLLDADGLRVTTIPPFADPDERAEGLGRAARETVLAMRRLRSPR